jgi:N utilization substance protein B
LRKRTLSREIALQLLYELDATGALEDQRIKSHSESRRAAPQTRDYARRLIEGVRENIREIDSHIEEFAENWSLVRMPVVDRTILRIATYELMFLDDIPPKVAINEAVDLAKRFGGADSGSFVNAILDKIRAKYSKQTN